MTKDEILQLVAEAAKVPSADIVVKERPGRQIKANALFEGSSSPANPRAPVGVFFATNSPDLAVEGAARRMAMDLPFPEAIVVIDPTSSRARVFGYADSALGPKVAGTLGTGYEPVQRPAFAREARPAGTLDASKLEQALVTSPNVVLQGPPGTGKSSVALELVRAFASRVDGLTSDQCRFSEVQRPYSSLDAMIADTSGLAHRAPIIWDMVQLHPGYGYEDLVRRVSPVSSGGQLSFEVQDRLLPKLAALAAARGRDKPVLLIMDEINRCNLAATLGECIFAIDPGHRGTPVRLQYQGPGVSSSLAIPENLWLVGTMNTADRSIAMVDYAIRRRFRFIDIVADVGAIRSWYAADAAQAALSTELFDAANEGLRPAIMVSHSAFMISSLPRDSWAVRMAGQFAYYVAPLLTEYAREGLRDARPLRFAGQDFDTEDTELAAKLAATLTEQLSRASS